MASTLLAKPPKSAALAKSSAIACGALRRVLAKEKHGMAMSPHAGLGGTSISARAASLLILRNGAIFLAISCLNFSMPQASKSREWEGASPRR